MATENGAVIDGKYKLMRKLGSGGFGNVWLASDILLPDRTVAIKSLLREHVIEESPLIDEMQFLNSLDHPNIVKFFHHIIDDNNLYLVMEYCKGGSLDQFRQFPAQPVDRVLGWIITIAETMEMVHSRSIIHHDIKPENLLLTEDGKIKIGDFGIANQETGTIFYLAPEQLLTELQLELDPRIDIYALGITMLELLTGYNPFIDLERNEILRKKIEHNFVPPQSERWIEEVILRATHPTPEQRFQSMTEFKEALVSRTVSYHFDSDRIRAHSLASDALSLLSKKKWKSAEKACTSALTLSPNCVPALIAAGKIQLMLQKTKQAELHFSKAISLNPRASVQKELGWIALQNENFVRAISMLNDHLQRSATDFEAYNLLLECLYKNDRYAAGEECCLELMPLVRKYECFISNYFLFKYLNRKVSDTELLKIKKSQSINQFLKFNIDILTESEKSYDPTSEYNLKQKLLFQQYRFNSSQGKVNKLSLQFEDGVVKYYTDTLISLGRNSTNSVQLSDATISRRHAIILNFENDIWIHDLGSTRGVFVDGKRISQKCFLNGVHDIKLGSQRFIITTNDGLLI